MKRTILALLAALLAAPFAFAGGGPETTLVVVNARSALSRRLANEYVKMRDIPSTHVLWLDGIPHQGVISLDEFKTKILAPLDKFLDEQGLADQIDLIEYSSGFPYGVNFRGTLPPGDPGLVIGGTAALNGVTYLAEDVKAGRPFWALTAGRYYRLAGVGFQPTPAEQEAGQRAAAALQAGKLDEGAKLLEQVLAFNPSLPGYWYNYACCLARLGRPDAAVAALERAAEEGFTDRGHASADGDLAPLRGHPEWQRVLGKMGSGYLPAHGFRCTYSWRREAEPAQGTDWRYRLATHLAYLGPFGNSLGEAMGYLKAAAGCDGTKPDGTVYLCKNGDVRSTAREQFFPYVIEAMRKLGRKITVLEQGQGDQTGILPVGKADVIGAVVGIAGFDWKSSKSTILPGAILEHLTSFGAVMAPSGQTKLTEFLRYGAAGASGTVMEPLSIHFKFPNPMIHAFYAEGCSLAEAFYGSLGGPFQTMIVGDGLARPFAEFPKTIVTAPNTPWRGEVTIKAQAENCDYELWVDGKRVATGAEMKLDTAKIDDGWHDVRVIAVSKDRIETRASRKVDAIVDNLGLTGSVKWTGKAAPFADGAAVLAAEGTKELEVLCGARVVAKSADGQCRIPIEAVGSGPVEIVPRLLYSGGKVLRLPPMALAVEEAGAGAAPPADVPRRPGLLGRAALKGVERPVVAALYPDDKAGPTLLSQVGSADSLVLAGELDVPAKGTYELVFTGAGTITVECGGRKLLDQADLSIEQYAALTAAPGGGPLSIEFTPKGDPTLRVALTGDCVYGPAKFRHASRPLCAKQPEIEGAEAGKPTAAGPDGLTLVWKTAAKEVAAIVLTPDAAAETFPAKWIVETPAGGKKWKPVEGIEVLVGPPEKKAPSFVEISLPKALKPGKLRVRPAEGTASVAKVEALGK